MKHHPFYIAVLFMLQASAGMPAQAQNADPSLKTCTTSECATASARTSREGMLGMMLEFAKKLPRSLETAQQPISVAGMNKTADPKSNLTAVQAASRQIDRSAVGDAKECDKFHGPDEMKQWAKYFVDEIKKPAQKKLWDGPADVLVLCKNYKTMTVADREGLWTIFAAGLAYNESTCQIKAPNDSARNGVAYGLLQLHLDHEAKYTAEHDWESFLGKLNPQQLAERQCKNGDSRTAKGSLTCGARMMSLQMERTKDSDGAGLLFSRTSNYWATLRANNREGFVNSVPVPQFMMNNICENTACGNDLPKCYQQVKRYAGVTTRLAQAPAKKKTRVAQAKSAR